MHAGGDENHWHAAQGRHSWEIDYTNDDLDKASLFAKLSKTERFEFLDPNKPQTIQEIENPSDPLGVYYMEKDWVHTRTVLGILGEFVRRFGP